MVEPLNRIQPREVESYIELSIYDPKVCTKAVAFTLTPATGDFIPSITGREWEMVTYYADQYSINREPIHPLDVMYGEWYSVNGEKDRGDEGDNKGSV